MNAVFALIYFVLMLFQLALILRIIYDVVQSFAREWRPQQLALIVASGVYAVTDPPVKALRRFIPPLRIGGIQLDLAFLVLLVVVLILMAVARGLAA